jgi:hypothetical protein
MKQRFYVLIVLTVLILAGCIKNQEDAQLPGAGTSDSAGTSEQPGASALAAEEEAYQRGEYAGTLKEIVREKSAGERVMVTGWVSEEFEPGIFVITDGTEEMAFRVENGDQPEVDSEVTIRGVIVNENGLVLIAADSLELR